MADLSAQIVWKNRKLQFEGVSANNPDRPLLFDFSPPLGDGDGFAGLELLLLSLAGCISTTIVFLLGHMGKTLTAYSAAVEGTRSEHPLALAEAHIKVLLSAAGLTDEDMRAVLARTEQMAPVWQAVKGNVSVFLDYEIV